MSEPLLEVKNLKKFFPVRKGLLSRVVGQVKAVNDVSFHIHPGETLSLVGESGCGKTTTGRALLRLIEPTDGEVLFDQTDVVKMNRKELRDVRKQMQIVFQDPYGSLNPRLTVRQIIEEGLVIHKIGSPNERENRIADILDQVGLDPTYMNRYANEFSGGQRQRICIARALILQPKFIVLDEPISALDVSIQSQIINELNELKEKFQLTYLFISHDLSVVEYISDRVAVMYLGEIVETATSEELYENPKHPYTQALLSAIPTMEPKDRTERVILTGDVPSPLNPPTGCSFHTRCPLAKDICKEKSPEVISISGTHEVRCHIVEEELASSAPASS